MIRHPDYFLAADAALLAGTALAGPVRERPRGTVTAISGDMLTVYMLDLADVLVALAGSTRYVEVARGRKIYSRDANRRHLSLISGARFGAGTWTTSSSTCGEIGWPIPSSFWSSPPLPPWRKRRHLLTSRGFSRHQLATASGTAAHKRFGGRYHAASHGVIVASRSPPISTWCSLRPLRAAARRVSGGAHKHGATPMQCCRVH